MKPLLSGFIQTQRFKAAAPHIRGDVLDIGCGNAGILAFLDSGQNYIGIEGHPSIFRWLKENYEGNEFHQLDLDRDVLRLDKQFDTILMLAIIEHLKMPHRVLSRLPQLLKPDGKVVITTPSPGGDMIHRIGARIGLFYMSAAQEHETIFTYQTLMERLEQNGLRIDHYRRFLLGGNQLFVCSAMGSPAE
ncbi:MAG: class I SAM-dependent methyltransferase [Anaerolineales bacterium]